jgi:hypothetical protein
MTPEVHVDITRFEEALVRYKVGTGKTWAEVILEQGRLMVQRVIALTPPRTRAVGRNAIARDVRRVFIDAETARVRIAAVAKWRERLLHDAELGDFRFRSASVQKAWEARDWATLEVIFARSDAKRFKVIEAPTNYLHQAARIRGRVPRGSRSKLVVPDARVLGRFVARLQQGVGITKAGWAAAMLKLGGKLPGWVSGQRKRFGGFNDQSSRLTDPSFTARNEAGPVADLDRELNLARTAIEGRARDMIRALEIRLEREAAKAGFR